MAFVLGEELLIALRSENEGLWFVQPDNDMNPCLLAKLRTDALQSLFHGTPTFVCISVESVGRTRVVVAGIRVDDSPDQPFVASGPVCDSNELDCCQDILLAGHARLHLFNELTHHALSATCSLDQATAAAAAAAIQDCRSVYVGEVGQLTEQAHDRFQSGLTLAYPVSGTTSSPIWVIQLTIQPDEPTKVHVIR